MSKVKAVRYKPGWPIFSRPKLELDILQEDGTIKTTRLWILGPAAKFTGRYEFGEKVQKLIQNQINSTQE